MTEKYNEKETPEWLIRWQNVITNKLQKKLFGFSSLYTRNAYVLIIDHVYGHTRKWSFGKKGHPNKCLFEGV